MFEDSECTDCELHHGCKHRCLPSLGDQDCKLAIFLDYPSVVEDRTGKSWTGDNAQFVDYCLKRMGVPLQLVYRDYIVKCYPKKMPGKKGDRMACVGACSQYRFASLNEMPHIRSIVVLGGLGCEAMTQCKTIGDRQGAEWEPVSHMMRAYVPHVWVGYSPGLLREKAAEAPSIFRMIWMGADEAGLQPVVQKIPPFEFKI